MDRMKMFSEANTPERHNSPGTHTKSKEIHTLKEKIHLKKMERQLFVQEQEDRLAAMKEERRALRVGNECLTYMTKEQLNMPVTLNAAIFQNHKNKMQMKRTPLQHSLLINDHRLFRYGKRLLREDDCSKKKRAALEETKCKLENARKVAAHEAEQYDNNCKEFLHKQVMVEDSLDHELSAKLTHRRLQKILEELNKDNNAIPKRIKQQETMITGLKAELKDFTALRDRANQYLTAEITALIPVNKELRSVNSHFFSHISMVKSEAEHRRKQGALAKFLTGREANAISYHDAPDILEAQHKKRGKMEAVYDLLDRLNSAALVSDCKNVIDCFIDQADVLKQLREEKNRLKEKNAQLRKQLVTNSRTNNFIRYNDTKMNQQTSAYNAAVAEEMELQRRLEHPESDLSNHDKLVSALQVAVLAMCQKLRPVKLGNPYNTSTGSLTVDMELVVRKTRKMVELVKDNTIPIGHIKPTMLSYFKTLRVPHDSVVGSYHHSPHGSLTSLQSFHLDHPNAIDREQIKQHSMQIVHDKAKEKKGGKKKK